MEAFPLLCGIGEVKAGAWADVIDMPLAHVFPAHAGGELAFKVGQQLLTAYIDQLTEFACFCCACLGDKDKSKSRSTVSRKSRSTL